jgi:hypothetical protein
MILQNVPTLRHILLDAAISSSKKSYTGSGELLSRSWTGAPYALNPFREGMWAAIEGGVQCGLWRQVHFS